MAVRKRGNRYVAEIWDTTTRRKRWLGTYPTRREAKEAFAQGVLAKNEGPVPATVDGFADGWTERYPRQKESTNVRYAEAISLVARDFEGRALTSISRLEARAYALKHPSRWKVARAMFSDALRDRLVDENPFADLRLPQSRGRRDLVVPTDAELDHLIDQAGKVWQDYGRRVYGPALEAMAFTGCRPGEWFALRWSDVDFNAQTLTIARQYNGKVNAFTAPKNGKTRTVALHPRAAGAIARMPQVREEIMSTPRGLLFTGKVSTYYFSRVAAAAGHPEWTPYVLRHHYGTYLARLGVAYGIGPIEIAQALGHTDGGNLAMRLYCHVPEEHARQRLSSAFDKATGPIPLREAK